MIPYLKKNTFEIKGLNRMINKQIVLKFKLWAAAYVTCVLDIVYEISVKINYL